jgi:signal-transduction protein with cAMP-binding, CBS, and nucleotidyltransferase domain
MNIAEDLIKDKNRELVSVPSSTTINEAVSLMAKENVGCLLVSAADKIEGIWTERDLVHNIAEHGFAIGSDTIDKYMSSPVRSCKWNESVYSLMDTFLGLRIRHVLVEKDGEYIGLLSSGDVMKSAIRAKDHDLAQANANLSWDYYEEWMYKSPA